MLISDRVSKHVNGGIQFFVIKDWQWIDNKVKIEISRLKKLEVFKQGGRETTVSLHTSCTQRNMTTATRAEL